MTMTKFAHAQMTLTENYTYVTHRHCDRETTSS